MQSAAPTNMEVLREERINQVVKDLVGEEVLESDAPRQAALASLQQESPFITSKTDDRIIREHYILRLIIFFMEDQSWLLDETNFGKSGTACQWGHRVNQIVPPSVVACNDNGHIEKINASETRYNGKLVPEIGALQNLRILEIQSSGVFGSIPTEIGTLLALETLDLSFNSLTGDVPTDMGSLTTLQTLRLNRNLGLSGALPIDLAWAASLTAAFVHGTDIIGLQAFCDAQPYTTVFVSSCQRPDVDCGCCTSCCDYVDGEEICQEGNGS